MKTSWIALCLIVSFAAAANAEVVAGWDFSQYRGDGLLSTDGSTFTNSLPANYSSLDPTNNAGAEAGSIGTLHMDGSNGSSTVTTSEASEVVPVAGSLAANLKGAAGGQGRNSFDALTVLAAEGQTFQQKLALAARSPANLVFEVDLANSPGLPGNFAVSFGGRTRSGTGDDGGELFCGGACSSTVGIEFSTNGSSYSSFGQVVLDPNEAQYEMTLGANTADRGFVRLSLDSSSGTPVIDNVAITVPDAGKLAQAATGLIALLGLGVLRRR